MRDSPRDIITKLASLVAEQDGVKIKIKSYAPKPVQEYKAKQAEISSLKTEYSGVTKLHA